MSLFDKDVGIQMSYGIERNRLIHAMT